MKLPNLQEIPEKIELNFQISKLLGLPWVPLGGALPPGRTPTRLRHGARAQQGLDLGALHRGDLRRVQGAQALRQGVHQQLREVGLGGGPWEAMDEAMDAMGSRR